MGEEENIALIEIWKILLGENENKTNRTQRTDSYACTPGR